MTKPELGAKHDCAECSARFYDLNKDPAVCPKCGTKFVPSTKTKAKAKAKVKVRVKAAEKDINSRATKDNDEAVLDPTKDVKK